MLLKDTRKHSKPYPCLVVGHNDELVDNLKHTSEERLIRHAPQHLRSRRRVKSCHKRFGHRRRKDSERERGRESPRAHK